MEKQNIDIPRFASPDEETPPEAIRYEVEGRLAFISAPNKQEPIVGNRLRLSQQEDVKTLLASLSQKDSSLIEVKREIQREFLKKAKRNFGPNRANQALRNIVFS